jgi:hypothetical protein
MPNTNETTRLIHRRIADIELLTQMITEETNEDTKMVWEYHINLDKEIIVSLIKGDLNKADSLMKEIRRSTIVLENYLANNEKEDKLNEPDKCNR